MHDRSTITDCRSVAWYDARVVGTRLPYSVRVLCLVGRTGVPHFNLHLHHTIAFNLTSARMGVRRVPPGLVAQAFHDESTTLPRDHPMARKAGPGGDRPLRCRTILPTRPPATSTTLLDTFQRS